MFDGYENILFIFDIFVGDFFFEMLQTQKVLRYLHQRDQKTPSGI